MNPTEAEHPSPGDLAGRLLGRKPDSVTQVGGGGNNRLYRVERDGHCFALKYYPMDERDRLGAEFGGLTFLAAQGIDCVPRPLAADASARAALYEWIDGQPPERLDEADLDTILAFFRRLQALAPAASSARLPLASAACLSADDAFTQLARRHERLAPHARGHEGLSTFLEASFQPGMARMLDHARAILQQAGLAPNQPLADIHRFPSPSDFGRHNMLRRPDGRLAFLDFEYFGWDDPVKAVSDFIWHPGSDFSHEQQKQLLVRCIDLFQEMDETFPPRLNALFGVFGLIWCLILLNEFVPDTWRRRSLANQAEEQAHAQSRQLAKAERLYRWIWEITDAAPPF